MFFVTFFFWRASKFIKREKFLFYFSLYTAIMKLYTYLLLFFIYWIGYGQEKVYQDNIVASVAVLKKLSDDWKVQATKLSPHEPLREILKNLRQKVIFHPSVCMIYYLFIASGITYQSSCHGLIELLYCIEVAECLNLAYDDLTILAAE